MLLTDGIPTDLTPIIERYNHLNNGSSIPVRIFTYLIGKEFTNVQELCNMSCSNRGDLFYLWFCVDVIELHV